ncbi:hypothetical protein NP493_46g02033 [Ridgeia piscesae]|uniref:Uncharacterized protein n=1 Tax=Ridgeia piscesae TaxID=27915 RepID=A0AAD9PBN9_RIDPI|nr:hypothetical protein NP493_46g02033 [Ridgeia piscesae]
MAGTNTVCMHLRRTARVAMAYRSAIAGTNNLTAPALFSTSQKPVHNCHKTPDLKAHKKPEPNPAMEIEKERKPSKFPEPFISSSIDPTVRHFRAEEGRDVMPPPITFSNGFTWSDNVGSKGPGTVS